MYVYHAFSVSAFSYLIPFYLVLMPFLSRATVNLSLSFRGGMFGLAVSASVLIPFSLFLFLTGRTFALLPLSSLLFQFCAIALPEEIYFRGFLQEVFGNTAKSVVLVSALFSAMHLPQLIIFHDPAALLTFFPSLVMGYLYLRTSNVFAPAVFHFLANIVYRGFYDIL